jgi:predicted DNA binding CopG/RHH family protein
MLKKLPILKTDQEAEDFVEFADLSEYDLSGFVPFKFEFTAKDERINMRLPSSLLAAVKAKAKEAGIPYQRFIRAVLEGAVGGK